MKTSCRIKPLSRIGTSSLWMRPWHTIWNGRRVIGKDWITRSLAVHAKFIDRFFGMDHFYGWGWHILHLNVRGHTYTEYESGGNGGQLVLILPE
jgi:hypothetical protein